MLVLLSLSKCNFLCAMCRGGNCSLSDESCSAVVSPVEAVVKADARGPRPEADLRADGDPARVVIFAA
jgi:hypothetical protein